MTVLKKDIRNICVERVLYGFCDSYVGFTYYFAVLAVTVVCQIFNFDLPENWERIPAYVLSIVFIYMLSRILAGKPHTEAWIREIKHDMDAHINMIGKYVDEENLQLLKEYVNRLKKDVVVRTGQYYRTGNETVDAVITDRIKKNMVSVLII